MSLVASAAPVAETSSAAGSRRSWSVVETARDNGRRLATAMPPRLLAPGIGSTGHVLYCNPAEQFQVIEGFGGALTESAAWALSRTTPSQRAEVLRRYYDPKDGLGYTLARTHINSCDFSLKPWSLVETAGDHELRSFDLAPMREWVLPLLHQARAIAGERLRFLASPWSPPAWMKTNGTMLQGGGLRADCRDAWARLMARFVTVMRDEEKLPIWAVTVQNEPAAKQTWESCLYTAEEERDFVRDHLGPALHAAGHADVKLLVWDHNRDLLVERATPIFADVEAARFVWGAALHWYVSEDFSQSSALHAAFPDKHILFTEGCWEGGVKLGKWDRGERYARNMIGDLRNWVCGWIDWNMVLDTRGGPNHVNNWCDAPVLVDHETGEVHYQSSFYYIGHFSRFVKPGARRVASSAPHPDVATVAFVNPDGELVVVALNETDEAVSFTLKTDADALACTIPAHAIQTYTGVSQ